MKTLTALVVRTYRYGWVTLCHCWYRLLAWLSQDDVRTALVATCALRLFCSVIAGLIPALLPGPYLAANTLLLHADGLFDGPVLPLTLPTPLGYLTQPWARWDTNWYLLIAQHGYASRYGSTAFMPLYPFLIWIGGSVLGGHYLFAALIISTVATFGTFLMLYRLVQKLSPIETAPQWTLVVALLLPLSFFFVAGYTESLFLWASIGALLASLNRQWGRFAVLAVIASLTRHQGLLLSLMILPCIFSTMKDWAHNHWLPSSLHKVIRSLVAPVLAGLAGPFVYGGWIIALLICGLPLPWEPLDAINGWNLHFTWPGAGVLADLWIIIHPALALNQGTGILSLGLDIGAAVLTGFLLALTVRRLPPELLLYAIACWCFALVKVDQAGLTVSAARYLLLLLPLAIVPGEWLTGQGKIARLGWLATGSASLIFCTWNFVLWKWVN